MDIREIEKKYGFEQKEQNAQKMFWVIVVLILIASLLGVFGKDGPMSIAVLDGADIYIKYERFMRDESPSEISLYIKRSREDSINVGINRAYIENVRIEEITPQPIQVQTDRDQVVYTFRIGTGGLIVMGVTPQEWGIMDLQITLHGKTHDLTQYTYF